MLQNRKRSLLSLLLALTLIVTGVVGCGSTSTPADPATTATVEETTAPAADNQTPATARETQAEPMPKYIFLFIGDGMGLPAITALANYRGTIGHNFTGTLKAPTPDNQPTPLWPSFVSFPVMGMASTQDSSKFITDSASAATAIAAGVKTLDGMLGMDAFGTEFPSIAELLKEKSGYKIGIMTSVGIDHATPAAFYSHIPSRSQYYDISMQAVNSDFDFIAGGNFIGRADPRHAQEKDIFQEAEENGWNVFSTREDILKLDASAGRALVVDENCNVESNLEWSLDLEETPGAMRLYEYMEAGIRVLDNEDGFFIMCEGGQIDWGGHLNDAFTVMNEISELELAVDAAIKFYNEHPDETLIIVTADHETGGLVNGYNQTHYNTYYEILANQTASYYSLYDMRNAALAGEMDFDQAMEVVREKYGLIRPDAEDAEQHTGDMEVEATLILTEREMEILRDAWNQSQIPWKGEEGRGATRDERYNYMYSPSDYEPWSLSVTRMLNARAGIGWTTTSHSGSPVPVFAQGVGAELFDGMIDNTDIFKNIAKLTNVN